MHIMISVCFIRYYLTEFLSNQSYLFLIAVKMSHEPR